MLSLLSASATAYALVASHGVAPRTPARRSPPAPVACDDVEKVPIPMSPMERSEITAKLDAVPVFSVVQRDTQEVVPTSMEQGTLCCTFHLDVAEAQQALEAAQQANPVMQLQLSATPLGTAFALCEWQQQLFPGGLGGGDLGGSNDDDDDGFDSLGQDIASASADPPGDFDDELDDAAAPREVRAELRLRALETEVECATPLLADAPVPPLLVRRNRLVGAVPLFGTDAIRFSANEGADAGATLQPLFFTRDHVRAAWAASGGAAEKMPPMQVTDLRTLVWQMQYDFSQDWRSLLFVVRAPSSPVTGALVTPGLIHLLLVVVRRRRRAQSSSSCPRAAAARLHRQSSSRKRTSRDSYSGMVVGRSRPSTNSGFLSSG